LLREKIVAAASKRMIVIADASKYVACLGAFALPVEVVPFGLAATRAHIARAGARLGWRGAIDLRRSRADGEVFATDSGHYILDCAFGAIADPEGLAAALSAIPGVVGHGLFIGLASAAVLAGEGGLKILGDLA
jgi:ribose 5-phosphate isomerase A